VDSGVRSSPSGAVSSSIVSIAIGAVVLSGGYGGAGSLNFGGGIGGTGTATGRLLAHCNSRISAAPIAGR
jgi:hypothetical protein